jgi:hypothetical protein
VRTPWFSASPVDESFFERAPSQLVGTFDIPRPAEQVWADLVADGTLWWCRILSEVAWTSARPFGVGTTRTVRALGGLSSLQERYFRWEEGRRKSFYVVQASAPAFKRLAEDYLVEPTGDGSCRFTWMIASEPHPLARPLEPINRRVLGTLFTDTRRHYGI